MSGVDDVEKIFETLPPADVAVLISLPYRVGVYVSYSDISGGWDAQEKELRALTGILRAYSEDFCKSDFSQKVLMDSFCARDLWPSWSKNIDAVPAEVAHLIDRLSPVFTDADLEEFKEVLLEIALAVAMAFREENENTESVPNPSGFTDMLRRIIQRPAAEDPLGHVNISPTEKTALRNLCDALSYTGFEKD